VIPIPAIDIKEGKVVRLKQGVMNNKTVYSSSPADQAVSFEEQGAMRIHIIDLDGASSGKPVNIEIIKKIREKTSLTIEVGGGIRNNEMIRTYSQAGIDKIILGSVILRSPDFLKQAVEKWGDKIIACLDADKGMLKASGWTQETGLEVFDFVKNLRDTGVNEIIYTDISRDGMLSGPNIKHLKKIVRISGIKVIASGGISSVEDIKSLSKELGDKISGFIVGKAIYEGNITVKDMINAC